MTGTDENGLMKLNNGLKTKTLVMMITTSLFCYLFVMFDLLFIVVCFLSGPYEQILLLCTSRFWGTFSIQALGRKLSFLHLMG